VCICVRTSEDACLLITCVIVGTAVNWKTMFECLTVDDDFMFVYVLLLLVFDSVFYCIVGWYVMNVKPGQFGIPSHWMFPVKVGFSFNID